MKIIISHDVDHLYARDHWGRDLFFPKMWVRTVLLFLKRKISFKTFVYRILSAFQRRQNRIEEVIKRDREFQVPSVFFFGMNQGLGMSYKPEEAKSIIREVIQKGFDVGVHGIEYVEENIIADEHHELEQIIHSDSFGIRTHYVRYDKDTFKKFDESGYLYDTSEFDKSGKILKPPYKVGKMWEFPLHIMEGYIIPQENLEQGIKNTIDFIRRAEESKVPYCTILFHDSYYDRLKYPIESQWYDWLLDYLSKNDYQCISYREAIKELEE